MPYRYPLDGLRRLAFGFTLCLFVEPVIAQPVIQSVTSAAASFSGKLEYTNGSRDYPLTVMYLQYKNLGRVTEQEVEMGDDNRPDPARPKIADTLVYDFSAGTVTVFQTKREWAVTHGTKRDMEIISKYVTEGIATLTKIGVEKVNGYTCTHWRWTVQAKENSFSSDDDLWITRDLGVPGLLIVGNSNYYTSEHPLVKKLVAAGGMGVLVKRVTHNKGRLLLGLAQVDKNPRSAQAFLAPAIYKKVDMSQWGPTPR